MGKRGNTNPVNYNTKPFNENADPVVKADEFDRQYLQNRTYTDTPAADSVGAAKRKGRHAK